MSAGGTGVARGARRRLRAVRPGEAPPRRLYDDWVVQEGDSGTWMWGCLDPIHEPAVGPTAAYNYATKTAAASALATHRKADDAERDRAACTCTECRVHGRPWVAIDLHKFGEPRRFDGDAR